MVITETAGASIEQMSTLILPYFNIYESFFILACTFITTLTFVPVVLALLYLHENRSQDVVLTGVAGIAFLLYRSGLGFN